MSSRRRTLTDRRRRRRVSRRGDPTIRVWLNEAEPATGRVVQVYRSRNRLIGELKQQLAAGRHVYVASNSKTFVEQLSAGLANEMPTLRQLLISADTRPGADQRAFLRDPGAEALHYDVIFATPAVSTGVDISFPGGEARIDAVVGFFESLVQSHFEIDQQIGRVRNPGEVKIWINPRRFAFETNSGAVKREMLEQALYKDLLIDHRGAGGSARYDEHDAFIEMAAQIVARDRASKNDLQRHFIEHKRGQGCSVVFVGTEKGLGMSGSELAKLGAHIDEENFRRRLLDTSPLRPRDFERVVASVEAGDVVDEAERWSLARTRIELFYRLPASAELIEVDERGKYRARVTQHERVLLESGRVGSCDEMPLDAKQKFIREGNAADIALLRALRLTPALIMKGFDGAAVFDSRDLGGLIEFLETKKSAVENLLGVEIRRDLRQKPISQLKRLLRLVGLDLEGAGTVKEGGAKIYRYRLDRPLLSRVNQLLRRRQTTPAWQFLAEVHGWADVETEDAELSFDDE